VIAHKKWNAVISTATNAEKRSKIVFIEIQDEILSRKMDRFAIPPVWMTALRRDLLFA
jgi:hypothetical protein